MVFRQDGSPLVSSLLLTMIGLLLLSGCGTEDLQDAGSLRIKRFQVTPEHLEAPGDVTIHWMTTGAASLELRQGDQTIDLRGQGIAQGTIVFETTKTTTFTLEARGAEGGAVTASREVTVERQAPSIAELTAPERVEADGEGQAVARISWSGIEGAEELSLRTEGREPVVLDPEASEGFVEVSLSEETTFTLVAANDVDEISRSVTIQVVYLPIIDTFGAERLKVGFGESSLVHWATTNAAYVELWQNDEQLDGAAQSEGSLEVSFAVSATLELRAYNELGTAATSTFEVAVGAPDILALQLSSDSLWLGESTTISWQTLGASELSLTLDETGEVLCKENDYSKIDTSSCTWMPTEPGIHPITLRIANMSGDRSSPAEVYASTGALVLHFDATPQVITAGDSLEVRWIVRGDPAGGEPILSLTDDRGNIYPAEEREEILFTTLNLSGPHEFRLQATTDHPSSVPHIATISVLAHPRPEVEFVATPSHFDDSEDDEVTLSWTTQDAETLVLNRIVDGSPIQVREIVGAERGSGSYSFVPRVDETYQLVATNTIGGATSETLDVTVAPLEVLAFDADPLVFTQGQEVRLSWVARMADEVTIDASLGGYLLEETSSPYLDLPEHGGTRLPMTSACGGIDTLGCAELNFPDDFFFPFGGINFFRVWVHTPGYLSFETTGSHSASSNVNTGFPTVEARDAHVSLAPFWDAMAWDPLRYSSGNVYTALLEENGSRSLVIQWRDIGYNSTNWRTSSFNFEVVLREDGSFDYRYGSASAKDSAISSSVLGGSSATIGFQVPDQSGFGVVSHNGIPSINGSRDHRTFSFKPLPALSKRGELVLSPFGRQENFSITLTAKRDGASHSKTVNLEVARKPLVELTPEELSPVAMGEEIRLGWKSFNASSLEVIDQRGSTRCTAANQALIDEGLCALTEELPGRHEYTVRATGAHGAVAERKISVNVFGDFGVASFTAAAPSVEKGGDVLLRWEIFAAASVTLYAGGTELFSDPIGNPAGSFLVTGVQQETEFKLVVQNHLGARDEATVTVKLWDLLIGLQPSSTSVRPGDPVTITVDARTLDGGAPLTVYGRLPMAELTQPENRFVDISSLPEATDLNISQTLTSTVVPIQLPFVFPYMGQIYTDLLAFVDGYISFTPGATAYASNLPFPTILSQSINVHLAPFWDDLQPRNIASMYSAQTTNDTFVIQWSKMSLNVGSNNANPQDLNFQVVLHRDGSFEYRYGTMAAHPTYRTTACFPNDCSNEVNGSIATVGYQVPGGSDGFTYHFGGTNAAATNVPVDGGLSHRTLGYRVIQGVGSFTFRPQQTETYSFCVATSTEPICKDLLIEAEFGLGHATLSKEHVGVNEAVTLSWKSTGGKVLNVLNGEDQIYTTSNLAEIDQGSIVLNPTGSSIYIVELLAGSRRDTIQRVLDMDRFGITASVSSPTSSGPGTAITLSWNLSRNDPTAALHVAAPMEEISNVDWPLYDISQQGDAIVLVGPNGDNTNARLDFVDFVFPFFGTEHSFIRVAADGYLGWDTANSASGNVSIPNSTGANATRAIVPFWDDLHMRQAGKVVAKKIDADRYVIQWSNVSLRWGSADSNQGDLNFLVVLHRNGSFEFRYDRMREQPLPASATDCYPSSCVRESNGSSATIGYQTPGGVAGYQLHFGGTNRSLTQPTVAGGLSDRAWRFTPHTSLGAGAVQVHPADNSSYKVCAFEPLTGEAVCAPSVGVDVPWGVDLFQVNPFAPMTGQPVTVSWSVHGVESLQIFADGTALETHLAPNVPLLGSLTHTPAGTTTYAIEVTSLDRTVRREQVVHLRAFDLVVTGPSGIFFPGDIVDIQWQLTPHLPGPVAMLTPLSEIAVESGQEGAFADVSGLPGAVEVTTAPSTSGSGAVSLPFSFPYLGTQQTSVDVHVDGYLSFSGAGGTGNGANSVFPAPTGTAARVHLAPFWDDLILRGGESIWHYAPDPNTLIVQWKQFSPSQSSSASDRYNLNFQVVLRSDGSFEYRYGTMEPPPPPFTHTSCRPISCVNEANGSSATVGYQSVDASLGSTLHIGSLTVGGALEIDMGSAAGDGFLAFPGGLSHRTFRYTPALSGSARIVVGRTSKQEVCGILGDFVECKSVRIESAASSGELMITEVMIDPSAGVAGQWFEVRNLTGRTIDMQGFELRSNQGSHIIANPLSVSSGGFVTFASSSLVPFIPDYIYNGEVPLNRLLDSLEVVAGASAINSLSWGITWNVPRNQVLSLDPSLHLTGIPETPDFEQWCHTGSDGSPGTLGNGCLNSWYEMDPLSVRPFLDISATGTRFHEIEGDQLLARLPSTGFHPKLFGETYTRLWVATNGWVSLSDIVPTLTPTTGPPKPERSASQANSLKGPLIAPFWNRLYCGVGCKVFYEKREISGEDVLIIQWQDYHLNAALTGSVVFQLQLWSGGDVVVAFDQIDNPHRDGSLDWGKHLGSEAWIGLESASPSLFFTAHHKRPLGLEHRSIHFRAK